MAARTTDDDQDDNARITTMSPATGIITIVSSITFIISLFPQQLPVSARCLLIIRFRILSVPGLFSSHYPGSFYDFYANLNKRGTLNLETLNS